MKKIFITLATLFSFFYFVSSVVALRQENFFRRIPRRWPTVWPTQFPIHPTGYPIPTVFPNNQS